MNLRFRSLIMAVSFLALILFLHTCSFLTKPIRPLRPVQIDIASGQSAWEISRALEKNAIISDAKAFMAIALITRKARRLQAGSYVFEGSHVPIDIMDILFRGKTLKYRITVPEGFTIYQIGGAVSRTGLMAKDSFVTSARSRQTTAFFGLDAPSMEGFLYPDTYYLAAHMTPLEIMAKMIDRFRHVYTPEMERLTSELGLTRLEIITLASLIEKEAASPDEKPLISSVFHNRLKKGMRLQSDPTAIYGIEGFTGKIGPDDLLREGPYNTYRHPGLPPGPICNPGIQSIRAALWPAKTSYLYFVSRGDGSHTFSSSLKDHNRAISEQSRQKKDHRIF